MKYIKKYNENIDWSFDEDENEEIKEIPYEKNGIIYGKNLYIATQKGFKNNLKFNLEDIIISKNRETLNKKGEIVDYDDGLYLIYFYDKIYGHDANEIPNGQGWWIREENTTRYK